MDKATCYLREHHPTWTHRVLGREEYQFHTTIKRKKRKKQGNLQIDDCSGNHQNTEDSGQTVHILGGNESLHRNHRKDLSTCVPGADTAGCCPSQEENPAKYF